MSASNTSTAGERFRQAMDGERPLQVVGTVNAICALLAERAGFRRCICRARGRNASHGLPDLGVTTLYDVLEDARRITAATELPLLVDADTGWGSPLMIRRTVASLIRSERLDCIWRIRSTPNAAAIDRGSNLCLHAEMIDRLKAALDARTDPAFVVMARTDAVAGEGIDAAIDRAHQYVEAGADMIFAEALTSLDEYRQFTSAIGVPVLANITEFGRTPLFTVERITRRWRATRAVSADGLSR